MSNRREPRLLSLDGGGARGWSQLLLLGHITYGLEQRLNGNESETLSAANLYPCQYFDIIVGSGTGGITALMIGRLGMSIEQCYNAWKGLDEVFDSPDTEGKLFDAQKLEQWAQDLVEEYTGDRNSLMYVNGEQNLNGKSCHVAVTSMRAQNIGHPALFRTYRVRANAEANCMIWEAIRATMASPSLFKSIYIGPSWSKQEFINAELGANNPVSYLIREKEALYRREGHYPPPDIGCIVSIGCGKGEVISLIEEKQSKGVWSWISGRAQSDPEQKVHDVMLRLAKDCERKHQEIQSSFSRDDRRIYFRVNTQHGMQYIQESDWGENARTAISAHVQSFRQHAEDGEVIDDVITELARLSPLPKPTDQPGSGGYGEKARYVGSSYT